MFATITNLRKTILSKAAAAVVGGAAGIFALAAPASADFRVDVGLRILPEREWCPPQYEDRQVRVWVPAEYRTVTQRVWTPAEYRTVTERVWVSAQYRDVTERVWVPPMYKTIVEDVWVPDVIEERIVERWRHGQRFITRERVCVSPAHWEKREFTREIRGGRYENVVRQEKICEGHWEDQTRQIATSQGGWREITQRIEVSPGHYETRIERVCVREGQWTDRPLRKSDIDIRLGATNHRLASRDR